MRMLKFGFVFVLGLVFILSCKQQYTILDGEGGGQFKTQTSSLPYANKPRTIIHSAAGKQDSTFTINPISDRTKEFGRIIPSHKVEAKLQKQVTRLKKFIPKKYHQKLDKLTKSKKQIFGYEGENYGMTLGLNLFLYSLIVFIVTALLVKYFYVDFLLGLSLFTGIIGAIIFIFSWIGSLLGDTSAEGIGSFIMILFGSAALILLLLGAFIKIDQYVLGMLVVMAILGVFLGLLIWLIGKIAG